MNTSRWATREEARFAASVCENRWNRLSILQCHGDRSLDLKTLSNSLISLMAAVPYFFFFSVESFSSREIEFEKCVLLSRPKLLSRILYFRYKVSSLAIQSLCTFAIVSGKSIRGRIIFLSLRTIAEVTFALGNCGTMVINQCQSSSK